MHPMQAKATLLTGTFLLALMFMLSACTQVVTVRAPTQDMPTSAMTGEADQSLWWRISTKMHWEPEQEPDWYMDALLADQVYAPALAEFGAAVKLWSFHRRAADDGAGHLFTLLVYADAQTVEALYQRIRAVVLMQWLESDSRISSPTMTKMARSDTPAIALSSDAAWPAEIQASWPWFIMGVSQTWLSLIRQVTAGQPNADSSPAALLDYYRVVHERVSDLWRDHGQHAYLHHLNALFGYQPLIIRGTDLKRF